MAHQVFISYATEDIDTAPLLCRVLEAEEGIRCWIAPRDVKAGTDYAAAILDAIKSAQLVVLAFSASANASPHVLREIERAVAYKRPVLALRIDAAAPSASIEYYVNLWQKLDATAGIEQKNDEIIAAVRGAIAAPGTAGGTRPGGARRTRILRRWSRRKWGIALASLLVVAAVGLGLGFGLTRAPTAAGVGAMHGQVTWSELHPPGTLPTPRYNQEMAQDPTSGRLIMFGGYAEENDGTALNDTWAYDPTANTWTELRPSGTLPSVRVACSMAYDPATHRLIMFGGGDDTGTLLNDTWAYDPAAKSWTELNPSGPLPKGRLGHVMVLDPSNRRLIMFGGRSSETDLLADTWAYDAKANAWTKLEPSGAVPPARAGHTMAYDPDVHRIILFGGSPASAMLDDTWAYDPTSNTWVDLTPAGSSPAGRWSAAMTYDSASGRIVMFGGLGDNDVFFSDTWAYDSSENRWTELESLTHPSQRYYACMICDSTGRVIMFGGEDKRGMRSDTWVCAP